MDDLLFRLIEGHARNEALLTQVVENQKTSAAASLDFRNTMTTQVAEMDGRVKGIETKLDKYEPTWQTLFAIHSTSRATKIVLVSLVAFLAALAGFGRNISTISHYVLPR
jgi:hypothetical protein